ILKEEIPLFWMRTLVRPGVTGWAQVTSGYASSVAESREKLERDLFYMRRMSVVLDLKILVKTLGLFLGGRDEKAL
uniref:sugar transferase n=1 Tax=Staphylococcus epidermidis TaxID=1282 RepID=UPI0027389761